MVPQAVELLKRMAAEYEKFGSCCFSSIEYSDCPGAAIDMLERMGLIIKLNDILGSIELTKRGYEAVTK